MLQNRWKLCHSESPLLVVEPVERHAYRDIYRMQIKGTLFDLLYLEYLLTFPGASPMETLFRDLKSASATILFGF